LKVTIVCAALAAGASAEFVKKVALRSVLIALIVCLLFAVLGEAILNLFKVSIPAFQIGGALIVLLFSLDMVTGEQKGAKETATSSDPVPKPSTPPWTSQPIRSRFP
jgi:multiple antibiotic resistance protein